MRSYWKSHYVTEIDPNDIERAITLADFTSGSASHELVGFLDDRDSPNILVSQGSSGHAYVFAELAYLMHVRGYNVFIMPQHGFYLALASGPMKSIVLQNAPAILNEERWRRAILGGPGAGGRRERFLPLLRSVSRVLSGLAVPVRLYLDFGELIDTEGRSRVIEERLVDGIYENDPMSWRRRRDRARAMRIRRGAAASDRRWRRTRRAMGRDR